MNDRHPSESPLPTGPAPDASYGHSPAYDSYGQQHPAAGYSGDDGADPLFGSLPGGYDTGQYPTAGYGAEQYGGAYETGAYAASSYGTGSHDTGSYATGAYDAAGYDTGTHHAMTYGTGYGTDAQGGAYDPYAHTGHETPGTGTHAYRYDDGYGTDTGAYPTGTHHAAYATGAYETGGLGTDALGTGTGTDTGMYAYGGDPLGTGSFPAGSFDTGSSHTGRYDAPVGYDDRTAYGTGGYEATATVVQPAITEDAGHDATAVWPTIDQAATAIIPAQGGPPAVDSLPHQPAEPPRPEAGSPGSGSGARAAALADAMTQATPIIPSDLADDTPDHGRAASPAVRGRGRRRTAKRSALLTIAVPSVAALGVCAAAAATVGSFGGGEKDEAAAAAPEAGGVKPSTANSKLDTQLAGLSAGADDFAGRASRTQERIDLKARQAAEKKRKEDEAKRKEAARPKFVLPVTQHGLSALFGQAGVNWMSVHTGIDFPVFGGTPVMAATDGTIRTQWNSAYGNMAIVTAPDGTETWYCHLSSTKIRSGSVKAGDQIAYSGDSGNSTGPHLHFEVRPGGGSPINPLPWLQSHGLNPN
ncbi:M23 family metallopeptidase [Streptomyces benahoarensis]|uniref:M23 family metallopeptidase n=1 Tax=Streptomyces benahoarensis TaxID=2595054 RepID=A0A553Z3L1_9ACTN|nr:M23 family metallopeptidase [Streptomyces benahoarensis]TSB20487.1 M23 family metallopeptidase [Streptomyces benahoarensis]TSB36075.1 M23 family metallopeptidase [Streptomyces benahoarensis]